MVSIASNFSNLSKDQWAAKYALVKESKLKTIMSDMGLKWTDGKDRTHNMSILTKALVERDTDSDEESEVEFSPPVIAPAAAPIAARVAAPVVARAAAPVDTPRIAKPRKIEYLTPNSTGIPKKDRFLARDCDGTHAYGMVLVDGVLHNSDGQALVNKAWIDSNEPADRRPQPRLYVRVSQVSHNSADGKSYRWKWADNCPLNKKKSAK